MYHAIQGPKKEDVVTAGHTRVWTVVSADTVWTQPAKTMLYVQTV